jgi:hypothetical protein
MYLIQYSFFNICSSAGIFVTNERELFHALHYSLLSMMPPDVCTQSGKFSCVPLEVLLGGKFSPVLPFCAALSSEGQETEEGERVREIAGGVGTRRK